MNGTGCILSQKGQGISGENAAISGYARGHLYKRQASFEGVPSAAIVGARACSVYGRVQAKRYARELAAAGVQIISGLATGVDAAAHEGALEGGGVTFAVLGCGVDICYPKENYPLMRRMLEHGGGILSEFEPGRSHGVAFSQKKPDHQRAGRSGAGGGGAETERFADYSGLRAGTGEKCLRSSGESERSPQRGCNRLIAQGAGIAVEPSALLEELGISANHRVLENGKRKLAKEEQKMIGEMKKGSHTLEELHQATGYPIPELSSLLVRMQLDGLIVEEGKNIYFYRE